MRRLKQGLVLIKEGKGTYIRIVFWLCVGGILLSLLPGALVATLRPSCEGCHGTQAEMLEQGFHAESDCRRCHEPSGFANRWGFVNTVAYRMFLSVPGDQALYNATVPNYACQRCHESSSGITHNNGINIKHDVCAEGIRCTSCHAGIFHENPEKITIGYTMDTCLRCHAQRQFSSASNCEMCHDGRTFSRTTMPTSFRAAHGTNWDTTHGLADLKTCRMCHEKSFCERCHGPGVPHSGTFMPQHSRYGKDPDNKCETCHSDTRACDRCHGIEMPHPEGFLKNDHSRLTAERGWDACTGCHIKRTDCDMCHVAHTHPGGADLGDWE